MKDKGGILEREVLVGRLVGGYAREEAQGGTSARNLGMFEKQFGNLFYKLHMHICVFTYYPIGTNLHRDYTHPRSHRLPNKKPNAGKECLPSHCQRCFRDHCSKRNKDYYRCSRLSP